MTLRSSKTDWLQASKLSINIEGAKAYVFIFLSSLQLIRSSTGMDVELERYICSNFPKNAWNRCDRTHCCQTSMLWDPYTFVLSFWGLIISFLPFHIHCFTPAAGILHMVLIHNDIVTNLNYTISPVLLPTTFSWYLKLLHMPTSLLLKAYFLINPILDILIFLNIFMKTIYKTKMLK